MSIVIDRDSGDIITGRFRVGHNTDLDMLRHIETDIFKKTDENGIYSYYLICRIKVQSVTVNLISYFKDDRVSSYSLNVRVSEEEWENWNAQKAERDLAELVNIMDKSGFRNPEDLPWGHVQAAIDARSGSTQLIVAYYKARR